MKPIRVLFTITARLIIRVQWFTEVVIAGHTMAGQVTVVKVSVRHIMAAVTNVVVMAAVMVMENTDNLSVKYESPLNPKLKGLFTTCHPE
jgi:hypothetical protein